MPRTRTPFPGRLIRRSASHNMPSWHPLLCKECSYVATARSATPQVSMNFTSFHGAGRTGNYVYACLKAFLLAFYCGARLQLPRIDDKNMAFDINPHVGAFVFPRTFANRSSCYDQVGNAGYFFHKRLPSISISRELEDELLSCLRAYLGICKEDYCKGNEYLQGEVLVAHIRNGDIFKVGFNKRVHKLYWQPPLSYYLAAMNSTNFTNAVFVGEHTENRSPVWIAMTRLQSAHVLSTSVSFQSSSIKEDIKTMICARYLVESRSTMAIVTRLGFAENTYSFACFNPIISSRKIYYSKFPHVRVHDNQPKEWVQMLTDPAEPFEQCIEPRSSAKFHSLLVVPCYFKTVYCEEASLLQQ